MSFFFITMALSIYFWHMSLKFCSVSFVSVSKQNGMKSSQKSKVLLRSCKIHDLISLVKFGTQLFMIIITNLFLFVRAYCTWGQYQRLPLLHIFCLYFPLTMSFQWFLVPSQLCVVMFRSVSSSACVHRRTILVLSCLSFGKTRPNHFHRFSLISALMSLLKVRLYRSVLLMGFYQEILQS